MMNRDNIKMYIITAIVGVFIIFFVGGLKSEAAGRFCFLGICISDWGSVGLTAKDMNKRNGDWSDWSGCSPSTTLGATGTKTRSCTNPIPANGGADCSNVDGGKSSANCLLPDEDGDGIRDDKDWCLGESGQTQWTGCAYQDPEIYGAEYRSSDNKIYYNARGDSGTIWINYLVSGGGSQGSLDTRSKQKGDWINYTIFDFSWCPSGSSVTYMIGVTPTDSKRKGNSQTVTAPCGGLVYPRYNIDSSWANDCKAQITLVASDATDVVIFGPGRDGISRYYLPYGSCGSGTCAFDSLAIERCGNFKIYLYNRNSQKDGKYTTTIIPFKVNDYEKKEWGCVSTEERDSLLDCRVMTPKFTWSCDIDTTFSYQCGKDALGVCVDSNQPKMVDRWTCLPGIDFGSDSFELKNVEATSGYFPLPGIMQDFLDSFL